VIIHNVRVNISDEDVMPTERTLHAEQGGPKILQPVHLGIEVIDLGQLVALPAICSWRVSKRISLTSNSRASAR
jgi:hypothetical protein